MGLINIPAIQNGDEANEELWNSRFATVSNVINGNIEAENITDGTLTTAKYGNKSVTATKIANGAVGSTQIADDAVTAKHINNFWAGPATNTRAGKTHVSVFNKTISLPEDSNIVVTYTSGAQANSSVAIGSVEMYINDVQVTSYAGWSALEQYRFHANSDEPFTIKGQMTSVGAGDVKVEVKVYCNEDAPDANHGFEFYSGLVEIQAFNESNWLA